MTTIAREGNQELLKASDIAKMLNISKAMVYKLMQTRQIPTIHIGQSRRVLKEDLENYIRENRVAG